MKRILLLLMFGLGLTFSQAQTPITIDDTQTLQQLIEDVLIVGDCADVSNITSPINSQINGQGFNSFGEFDATNSSPSFPFNSGIILATSSMQQVTLPPSNAFGLPGDGDATWPGDAIVDDINLSDGTTTSNNATVIEFDFVPYVDEINFNYIFASREYPDFVCTFADTFAFILSGPGISNVNDYDHDANPNTPDLTLDLGGLNIALAPGTNIPISAVNVHQETCFADSQGEFAIPQLYDNASFEDGTTVYNGRTVPLTASAQVIPGGNYTIKLVIADWSDNIFGSAVFLEAESFDLGDIDLGEDLTISGENAGCFGETITLNTQLPNTLPNTTFLWALDGNIIPGENNPTLEVTAPGSYEAGVQIGDGGCILITPEPIVIEFYPELDFGADDSFILCDGETITLDGEPSNSNVYPSLDYQWTKDGNELAGETDSTLTVSDGGIYELVVTPPACSPQINSYIVNLINYEVSLPAVPDPCISSGDTVTLTPAFTNLTQDEIDNDVFYEWTTNDGVFTTPTVNITEGQEVTLTTTFQGCEESATETFTFFNNPDVAISGSATICQGDTLTLDGTPSNLADLSTSDYSWFLDGTELIGETNATLDITEGGTYEVIVDNNGCDTQSAEFEVELVDYQVSLPAAPDPCIGSGTTVTVSADFTELTQDQIDNEVTYLWTVGNDTFTTPTIELDEGQEVSLTTTFRGCPESVTETFVFFNTPEVDIAGADILCGGETNTLNATPMNLNDLDQNNLTYSWTLDGAPIAGDTPVLDITDGGVYEVTVNNNNCVTTSDFSVELVEYTLSFDDTNIVLCTGTAGADSVELDPTITGLTTAQENQIFYNWSDGSTGETLTVSNSGSYSVEVDINGNCVQSATVDVTFIETVQASVNDAIKCPGDSITLQSTLSSEIPGVTYQWSFNGSVLSNETGSSITVTEEGDYTLVVDNQGCESNPVIANVSGYAVDNCVITQGISPGVNGDGFNDCMDLTWLSDESGIRKISVFNRYGRKVFEENNYINTFCGQDDNGDELSTGTYFYVIELERESVKLQKGPVIKGWVYVNAEQQ